jgi:ribosomal protein S18 acetylase RimI-like enzyme
VIFIAKGPPGFFEKASFIRRKKGTETLHLTIREALLDDAPALTDLLQSLEMFPHLQVESSEKVRQQVSQALFQGQGGDGHSVYVAQDPNGEILGYCAVHWLPYLLFSGPEGYVSELFIRKEARGRGIGRRLLEAVKEEAEERGCSRLMLLNLRHRESYQRGFYKKQGWEERTEAANFILKFKG